MIIHNADVEGVVRGKLAGGFAFGEVVFIVADHMLVGKANKTKLVARLKHFQRLGMPERKPGRGAKTPYNIDEILGLAFCFELVEAGIEPQLAVEISKNKAASNVKTLLRQEFDACIEGLRAGIIPMEETLYMWFEPHLSTFSWKRGNDALSFPLMYGRHKEFIGHLSSVGFSRVTVYNIGALAHSVYVAFRRLTGTWE